MTVAADEQPIDERLLLLARAAARHLLLEMGEIDIDEASEGLVDEMTFCPACKRADAKVTDNMVPLERAYSELNSRRGHAVPASTVEALVYACRQGPQVVNQSDNLQRLVQLDKAQLREVHERVQRFPADLQYEGEPVTRWTAEQADALIERWSDAHD